MALLTTQVLATTGTDLTFVSASGGGDTAQVGDGYCLLVKNASGGSITATLATPNTVDGLAIADRAVAVGAGVTTSIPLAAWLYKDPTDGYVHITYSAVTSVTVTVIKVPT
jgi:hypothetical protein